MADEKLLRDLTQGVRSGMTEEQVKEKLVRSGWNINDVNGAYALHILSQKPIGSNLMSAWKKNQTESTQGFFSQALRSLGLVVLLLILAVFVDWNGYALPAMNQYQIRTLLEERIPALQKHLLLRQAPPARYSVNSRLRASISRCKSDASFFNSCIFASCASLRVCAVRPLSSTYSVSRTESRARFKLRSCS